MPYLRHRWALAAMLGSDETDIWPQVGAARSRSEEVLAIYPHREDVPRDLWRGLFSAAETEISILDVNELFLAEDRGVLATLENLGGSHVATLTGERRSRDPTSPGRPQQLHLPHRR